MTYFIIPCSFDPTPKEFHAHFTLPLMNSKVLDRGGGMRLLNGVAICNTIHRNKLSVDGRNKNKNGQKWHS